MAVIWVESDGNRLQLDHFAGFLTELLALAPLAIFLFFSSSHSVAAVKPQRDREPHRARQAERQRGHQEASQTAEFSGRRASETQKNTALCQREKR